jgi:hypothetical protein
MTIHESELENGHLVDGPEEPNLVGVGAMKLASP